MIPGKYNMVCPQGATFSQVLTYSINDVAVNLFGYSARMQVREKHTSPTAIVSLTSPSGGIILQEEDTGTISITVSDSVTSTLVPKDYVYDIELVSPSNQVYRIIEGKFIVTPEVTR